MNPQQLKLINIEGPTNDKKITALLEFNKQIQSKAAVFLTHSSFITVKKTVLKIDKWYKKWVYCFQVTLALHLVLKKVGLHVSLTTITENVPLSPS